MADVSAPMAGGGSDAPPASKPGSAGGTGARPGGSAPGSSRRQPTPIVRVLHDNPKRLSLLPKYWYVFPLTGAWVYYLYTSGWYPYALAFYMVYPFITPFGDWVFGFRLFFRILRGTYEGYYWTQNFVTLGVLLSRLLFLFPLETFLWYLDLALFPGYRNQPVEQPLFLLGQPRSGTTKLEEILSEDEEHLVALRLIEMRLPYLTVQYLLDALVWLDRRVLCGALKLVFFDLLHWNHPYDHKGPRHDMRRLQYEKHDEDDILFLFHQMHHFQINGVCPDPELVRFLLRFDTLSPQTRRRMMLFHRQCVQKVLYRRGSGKKYFAKWVAGWSGQLHEARVVYPDAQFIVISLLSIDMGGEDMMARPHILKVVKEENINWFKSEIEFCRTTSPRSLYLLHSEEFYNDIPTSMRKIYAYFNREIVPGSRFDQFLNKVNDLQSTHKRTKTDESHLTQQEIRTDFPDLVRELFPNGVKSGEHGLKRLLSSSSVASLDTFY